jgi:cytochrome c biogenesis protein CcdA
VIGTGAVFAIDTGRFGLNLLRGMLASVNPCGFVLLPTYLMYFLGIEATRSDDERATVRRALLVGASMTAGFMVVFVVVGGVTKWSTDWVLAHAKYVTGVAGVGFVVLGIAMLFGFKLRLSTPALAVGERDTTVRSMFVYGVVYATVSLSCTLVLFAPLFFERGGIGVGVVNGAAFAFGMGLLVTALTVALAVANHALLRVLRTAMQHVQALAGAFVLLSGLYLLYYFWVVDVRGGSGRVNEAVQNFQDRITNALNANWEVVAVVLSAVVIAALAYVGVRRRPPPDRSVGSPVREPSS